MQEDVIKFKTAKLAQEKGYVGNSYSYHGYDSDGKLCYNRRQYNDNVNFRKTGIYAAPTQSLLQKWLREVHSLRVEVSYDAWGSLTYDYQITTSDKRDHIESIDAFHTHEEALEEGLQVALDRIEIDSEFEMSPELVFYLIRGEDLGELDYNELSEALKCDLGLFKVVENRIISCDLEDGGATYRIVVENIISDTYWSAIYCDWDLLTHEAYYSKYHEGMDLDLKWTEVEKKHEVIVKYIDKSKHTF